MAAAGAERSGLERQPAEYLPVPESISESRRAYLALVPLVGMCVWVSFSSLLTVFGGYVSMWFRAGGKPGIHENAGQVVCVVSGWV